MGIEFYCPDEAVVVQLFADVRGAGNPIPALAALCRATGWAIVDADGVQVDLSVEAAAGWEGWSRRLNRVLSGQDEPAVPDRKPPADCI